MPTHQRSLLTDLEIEAVLKHWKKYFPESLKDRPEWLDTREDPNRTGLLTECAFGRSIDISVTETLSKRPEVAAGHWTGDIGSDVELCGFKFDIKAQLSHIPPQPRYRWNVPYDVATNPNKECDGYIWTFKRLGDDTNYWLIGWMFRGEFLDKAHFGVKGSPFSFRNGYYTCDTYDITDAEMRDLSEFKRSLF